MRFEHRLLVALFLAAPPIEDAAGFVIFRDTVHLVPSTAFEPPLAEPFLKLPLIEIEGERFIEGIARAFAIDPYLVYAVIKMESGGNPRALSPKGAMGLMQLMPGTAKRFGVLNPWDPVENVRGGVQYLRFLLDLFHDVRLALAAYNAGEGAVESARGIPPIQETREYVAGVLRLYQVFKGRQEYPVFEPAEKATLPPAYPLVEIWEKVLKW